MTTKNSKMEPWQLILIIILMGSFFAGLYMENQMITTRIDNFETVIEGRLEMIGRSVKRIEEAVNVKEAETNTPD
ncbi:MAG: hypothetical protein GY854_13450 [Deltaproteobacteria bacterium]|nr:hypothetical protein [Deltaproteobacteria bacterium]